MSTARIAPLLALLFSAGCLQPGPLPEGNKLFAGRDISGLSFVLLDADTVPNTKIPWVAFSRRRAPATPEKGTVSDLWIASLDGTQQRLVIDNRSDRWSAPWSGGSLFTMTNERQISNGGSPLEPVGTLVSIDSHFQRNLSFENISSFAPDGQHDNRLLYRQVPDSGEIPAWFLWDNQVERRLGDAIYGRPFNAQFSGSGAVYFVGNDGILSRLRSVTDTIEALHPGVSNFNLRGDEKYAALTFSDATATKTVVFDLQANSDIPLARPNPCCWLGFAGSNLFTYSQSKIGDSPAEYHALDVTTGADAVLVLPDPLVDLVRFLGRPGGDELVYIDSQSHGVFYGQNDQQARRTVKRVAKQMVNGQETEVEVAARILAPLFTDDGKYLIYVDPQPTTVSQPYEHGLLMVQEADFADQPLAHPPRQLSSDGMSVRPNAYFFIDGPSTDGGVTRLLVFWAGIVRGSEDVYFANYETGDLQVVAHAIGNVEVDSQEVFGTVNVSAQDVVGDLVVKDVRDTGGRTLAHAVSEATRWRDDQAQLTRIAYVVRGRTPSDHDGLWLSTQEPPGQDGGQ